MVHRGGAHKELRYHTPVNRIRQVMNAHTADQVAAVEKVEHMWLREEEAATNWAQHSLIM